MFAGARIGVAVRYPSAWQLTTYNNTFVPDPALCFELAPTANAGVDVKVVEYLPPYFNPRYLSTYPRRPRRFSLESLQPSDDDWSPGKLRDAWARKWDGRWHYEARDGSFHHEGDPDGGPVLVFSVTPTKVFAFAKGQFGQTRHRF
jgi:hypothetical protein